MRRLDERYIELLVALNGPGGFDGIRTLFREALTIAPDTAYLQELWNRLLLGAREKNPTFSRPAGPEAVETCSSATREMLADHPARAAFVNTEFFREVEELYLDREMRMAITAYLLMGLPSSVPPDCKEDQTSVLLELGKIHRNLTLTEDHINLFALLFCPRKDIPRLALKTSLRAMCRTFPAEAELYSCAESSKFDLDHIRWKLKGSLEFADPDKLIKNATNYAYFKFMEGEAGPGPDAMGQENSIDWFNRFVAGYDRLLKKKMVDHATAEPEGAEAIEMETDPPDAGVGNVEDIPHDMELGEIK